MAVCIVNAEKNIGCGDQWSRIEGNFCQGDDGNEDAHQDCQGLRITLRPEDVRGDGIGDPVAEHDDANDCETGIKNVGERKGDVDSLAPFLGVAHIAVDGREDRVRAPR